jgi:mRNA interferase MazF
MKRGEIRMANLEPVLGAEANKRRPCVIVSNDGANRVAERLGRGVLTVIPITTSTGRVYPFQVLLPSRETGLSKDSKAQAEQVRSISVGRIGEAVGNVPTPLLGALDDALRLHLAL